MAISFADAALAIAGGAAGEYNRQEAEQRKAQQAREMQKARMREAAQNLINKSTVARAETEYAATSAKRQKALEAAGAYDKYIAQGTEDGAVNAALTKAEYMGARHTNILLNALKAGRGIPAQYQTGIAVPDLDEVSYSITDDNYIRIDKPDHPAANYTKRQAMISAETPAVVGNSDKAPSKYDQKRLAALAKDYLGIKTPTAEVIKTEIDDDNGTVIVVTQNPDGSTASKQMKVEGFEKPQGDFNPTQVNFDSKAGKYYILNKDGTTQTISVDGFTPTELKKIKFLENVVEKDGISYKDIYAIDYSGEELKLVDSLRIETKPGAQAPVRGEDADERTINLTFTQLLDMQGEVGESFRNLGEEEQKNLAVRVANVAVALRKDPEFGKLTGNERFREAYNRVVDEDRAEILRQRIRDRQKELDEARQ